MVRINDIQVFMSLIILQQQWMCVCVCVCVCGVYTFL